MKKQNRQRDSTPNPKRKVNLIAKLRLNSDIIGVEARDVFRFRRYDPSKYSYRREYAGKGGNDGRPCRSDRLNVDSKPIF